jgi:hypothetical protein
MNLFVYGWKNCQCFPSCFCGWKGEATLTLKAAKTAHKRHVRDDCPIGAR